MKITIVGSGNDWTDSPNSSYLVERDDGKFVLVDIGCGIEKELEKLKLDFSKLDTVLISHFHEDHFGDFYTLYILFRARVKDKKLNVIAPKRFVEKLKLQAETYESPISDEEIRERLNVVELSKEEAEAKNSGIDIGGGYTVTPYPVEHIPEEAEDGSTTYNRNRVCLGYTIAEKSSGMVAGFSGDTQDCENLRKIVEAGDVLILDAGSVNRHDGAHLSYEEYLEYKNRYGNKKFYATHVGGRVHEKFNGRWKENPKQGTQIYIGSEPPYSLGD